MGPVRSLSLISGPGEVMVLYWAMLPGFCTGCILGRAPHTKETLSNHGSQERGHDGVVSGYLTITSFPWVDRLSTDPQVLGRNKKW